MDQVIKDKEAGQISMNTESNDKANKSQKPIEYTEIYAWGGKNN